MGELGGPDEGAALGAGPVLVASRRSRKAKPEVETASLGCARCGKCCEHISMNVDWGDILVRTKDGEEDATFISAHWKLNPEFDSGDTYACDMLDRVTGLCTAHEGRPPVCRNYPWYGEDPEIRSRLIGPQCSYLLDVAPESRPPGSRPLIPLTVLRHAN